jgi:hypothetical protein
MSTPSTLTAPVYAVVTTATCPADLSELDSDLVLGQAVADYWVNRVPAWLTEARAAEHRSRAVVALLAEYARQA